jgi:hypothetical protein
VVNQHQGSKYGYEKLVPKDIVSVIGRRWILGAVVDGGDRYGDPDDRCHRVTSITTGYSSFVPAGSYTPATLTGGMTVALLVDINEFYPGCPNYAVLGVKGFESHPGSGWLTSVTCNRVTNRVSTAQFQYIANQNNEGQWTWTTPSGSTFGFLSPGGGAQVSCTIAHN